MPLTHSHKPQGKIFRFFCSTAGRNVVQYLLTYSYIRPTWYSTHGVSKKISVAFLLATTSLLNNNNNFF